MHEEGVGLETLQEARRRRPAPGRRAPGPHRERLTRVPALRDPVGGRGTVGSGAPADRAAFRAALAQISAGARPKRPLLSGGLHKVGSMWSPAQLGPGGRAPGQATLAVAVPGPAASCAQTGGARRGRAADPPDAAWLCFLTGPDAVCLRTPPGDHADPRRRPAQRLRRPEQAGDPRLPQGVEAGMRTDPKTLAIRGRSHADHQQSGHASDAVLASADAQRSHHPRR